MKDFIFLSGCAGIVGVFVFLTLAVIAYFRSRERQHYFIGFLGCVALSYVCVENLDNDNAYKPIIVIVVATCILFLWSKYKLKILRKIKRAFSNKAHTLNQSESKTNIKASNAVQDMSIVDNMDGQTFEYWCANLLRQNGFHKVEVTQTSRDQGVDIIAYKDEIKYAIQCKRYSSDLGNTPVQEVNTGKQIYGCHIGVVMTNRYFTQGAIDAAKATNVLLWDRDKLMKMMKHAEIK